MNIVVTDGFTLNSGDLSWQGISRLGLLTVYDRTDAALIEERCKDAEIILTNKVPFTHATLSLLPNLKCISVLATGYNVIDTEAASEKGIVVCNVPGYGTYSVAQHVFALLLELTNGVGLHGNSVKQGGWQQSADWCYTMQAITELNGKTMGIIGFGHIGQQVARIADAFHMKVIYYNPRFKDASIGKQKDLEEVFAESDVVSLHCPLQADNKEFVNKERLHQMKRTAFLINTARGQLIKENDLAAALNSGMIAGAALDVLSAEPPPPDHPLIKANNCIVTPHNAWMSREARQRVMDITEKNIEAFLRGQPVNRVN